MEIQEKRVDAIALWAGIKKFPVYRFNRLGLKRYTGSNVEECRYYMQTRFFQ